MLASLTSLASFTLKDIFAYAEDIAIYDYSISELNINKWSNEAGIPPINFRKNGILNISTGNLEYLWYMKILQFRRF